MTLLDHGPFRPFNYPWAYRAWETQMKLYWLGSEIDMTQDVLDFAAELSDHEREVVTNILMFFTQADGDVSDAYIDLYLPTFKPKEVRMMMGAFSAFEGVHQDAYSRLVETLGLPESTYTAFREYEAMLDKHEYLQKFNADTVEDAARSLAVFSAFTEGLQLFGSFIVLMNFPRQGKMRGLGQIIQYSVRDESLHVASMIKLFSVFLTENKDDLDLGALSQQIAGICEKMVECEEKFLDLVFAGGDLEGLKLGDVKAYIRFLAHLRLRQLAVPELGFNPIELSTLEGVSDVNPLPWVDEELCLSGYNDFFAQKGTEYAKAAITGEWSF